MLNEKKKKKFDIIIEFGKIESSISESNKKLIEKSTKKSLIDHLSKRLSELKFEKHNSIKLKFLKWIVKKYGQIIKRSDKKKKIKLQYVKKKISHCLKCGKKQKMET